MARKNAQSRPSAKSIREKRDDDIMLTNDSSIVSKQSVVALYHRDQPDLFRPFVARSQRRAPLINRGYWLRMRAVEHTVTTFLKEQPEKKKVVINLGCGYDPLPFHFLHHHPHLSSRATFVDVDYPPLMLRKQACIIRDTALHALLPDLASGTSPSSNVWRAGRYLAVGCDLRQLAELEHILDQELQVQECAILFVAEVSVAYMDVKSADAVISWASSFDDARFCILEQCLPDGPGHPFARTMLSHFEKLHTHLKVVYQYPTLAAQRTRFLSGGWSHVDARTLWELWGDDDFLPAHERRALDSVEPFDEWEEFALFSSHYLLLVARTSAAAQEPSCVSEKPPPVEKVRPAIFKADVSIQSGSRNEGQNVCRRFGAMFSDGNEIIHHGGYGARGRLKDCDVYFGNGDYKGRLELKDDNPGPLVCHTITNVSEEDNTWILVGGRTSPNNTASAAWIVGGDGHCHVTASNFSQDSNHRTTARYRHCSTKVAMAGRRSGTLVFGGKCNGSKVMGDFLFRDTSGWHGVQSSESVLPARFGAVICTFKQSPDSGLIMGGISEDGIILSDVWMWKLDWKDTIPHITCTDLTAKMDECSRFLPFGRVGAHLLPCPGLGESSFLLIGGVTKNRVLTWDEEILLLTFDGTPRVSNVRMPDRPSLRPLFVGMGATHAKDKIVLAGGGGVCFSMGSFWNSESYILCARGVDGEPAYPATIPGQPESDGAALETPSRKYLPSDNSVTNQSAQTLACASIRTHNNNGPKGPEIKVIPRIRITTQAEFEGIVADCQPVILEGLDIGPCVNLWTPEYLLEHIGKERAVIVHSCSTERMTFQTKNFSYIKQSFGEFIKDVTSGGNLYLRAVASTQPAKHATNLAKDFPGIADDFKLPPALCSVTENLHSSPLRISGPVTLWLHYDVLANVLCQICGTKRLRLYPPTDVPYLSYAPGASSSNIDVYDAGEGLGGERYDNLRATNPHEAFLQPGDVLFLPPAWSHTAKPEEGVSVAVNCFWRNMESKVYAVGRDVYGNRDLAAYEEGRKAVEKMAKAFEGVPKDMTAFYLSRLVSELRENVEGVQSE